MNKEKWLKISGWIFLTAILLLCTVVADAQEKVKVKASGSYISRDLTPEQTRQKALDEAKRDALIKAGVGENITVSDFLYTFEDNEKFQQIFQDFTSTQAGGEVMIDTIISESKDFNDQENMVVKVEVEATVFIHKGKEDPEMKLKVEGIEEFYKNGQTLKFSVTPSVDGYLKIFNVTDEEISSMLFPYKDDKLQYMNDDPAMLLKSMQKVVLPVNKAFSDGYTMEISNPAKDKEFNLLIFVFTRENIPFMDDASDMKQIMSWIYSLPVEKRKVEQFGLVIRR